MRTIKFLVTAAIGILPLAAFAADSSAFTGTSAVSQSACPNLPGYTSATAPQGMAIDAMGNCVPSTSGAPPKPKKTLYSGSSQGMVSMDNYHGVFCYDSSGWCAAPIPMLNLSPPINIGGVTLSLIEGGAQTGYTSYVEYVWNAFVQGYRSVTTIKSCESIKINGNEVAPDFSISPYGYIGGSLLHGVFSKLPLDRVARLDLVNCEIYTVAY